MFIQGHINHTHFPFQFLILSSYLQYWLTRYAFLNQYLTENESLKRYNFRVYRNYLQREASS